jgi:hypothetical protein
MIHITQQRVQQYSERKKEFLSERLRYLCQESSSLGKVNHHYHSLCEPFKIRSNKALKFEQALKIVSYHINHKIIADMPQQSVIVPSNVAEYLHRGSSNAYGIGWYVYQIINGVEMPIAFISKSLVSGDQSIKGN